ncbi:hypothetical protein SRHO_G00324270 [Serrasalmus rhombeus]
MQPRTIYTELQDMLPELPARMISSAEYENRKYLQSAALRSRAKLDNTQLHRQPQLRICSQHCFLRQRLQNFPSKDWKS